MATSMIELDDLLGKLDPEAHSSSPRSASPLGDRWWYDLHVDCLFCLIAAGQVPAFVVNADEIAVAFLDTRPVFKGHILVIPRPHVPTLADLSEVGLFFERVQAAAVAVETGLQAQGTFVAMNNRISQSVPHLHAHVIPRSKGDGLKGFFWPRSKYTSDAEAQAYAGNVRDAWPRSIGSGQA